MAGEDRILNPDVVAGAGVCRRAGATTVHDGSAATLGLGAVTVGAVVAFCSSTADTG